MPPIDNEKRKAYNSEYYLKIKKQKSEHNKEKNEQKYDISCQHKKSKYQCDICRKELGLKPISRNPKKHCIHGSQCFSRCSQCLGHPVNKGNCSRCKKKFDGEVINGKLLQTCNDCRSKTCPHDKQFKKQCKICRNEINKCSHNKQKHKCKVCYLQLYLVNLQRNRIYRFLNDNTIKKTKTTVEYLDCSPEYFKNFIKSKMVEGMTFDNIHIDHIKPVSRFNLEDPEELLKCCHYTNFQPLFSIENLEKSNKWSEEDETFWNENIIFKEYLQLYNSNKLKI